MISRYIGRFRNDQKGTVLVEALLALPLLTIFTFGLLEFGNLMWQRQQLQVGVRDAARYWARCRPDDGAGNTFMPCSIATARNIAFFGNPAGSGSLRVPGWDSASELTISPTSPPGSPTETDMVVAGASFQYEGSPVFRAVFDQQLNISYYYTTRYLGW